MEMGDRKRDMERRSGRASGKAFGSGVQCRLSDMDNKYRYYRQIGLRMISGASSGLNPSDMLRGRISLDGQRRPREDKVHRPLESFFLGGLNERKNRLRPGGREGAKVWDPPSGRAGRHRDRYSNS